MKMADSAAEWGLAHSERPSDVNANRSPSTVTTSSPVNARSNRCSAAGWAPVAAASSSAVLASPASRSGIRKRHATKWPEPADSA